MAKHPFILEAGSWKGEGKIKFSMMEDQELSFVMLWTIPAADKKGKIAALQEIRISGIAEGMCNRLMFYDVASKKFSIELKNQSLGIIVGNGVINSQLIGWEFRLEQFGFEGFEFYEACTKKEGDYLVHAEYATSDDFRTIIHGRMWRDASIETK